MKLRPLIMALCLSLTTGLLAGCGLSATSPPAVASLTLTDRVDERTKEPLTDLKTFPSQSTELYASIKVTNPREGTKVEARWLYDDGDDGDFRLIDSAEVIFGQKGDRHVAFRLRAATLFPDGAYTVEIYLDNVKAAASAFRIQ